MVCEVVIERLKKQLLPQFRTSPVVHGMVGSCKTRQGCPSVIPAVEFQQVDVLGMELTNLELHTISNFSLTKGTTSDCLNLVLNVV